MAAILHPYPLQMREGTFEGSYGTKIERLAAVIGLQQGQHHIVQFVSI